MTFLILGSHFRLEGDAQFLLDALPPVVLLESEAQRESLRWAVDRLLREMRKPQPGSTLIAQQTAYTNARRSTPAACVRRRGKKSRLA